MLYAFVGTNILLASKNVIRLSYSLLKLNLGQVARVWFETMRREAASLRIQKQARTYICQKAYKSMCSSACSVQTGMRAKAARVELQFRKKRRATIIIQASLSSHIDEIVSLFAYFYTYCIHILV